MNGIFDQNPIQLLQSNHSLNFSLGITFPSSSPGHRSRRQPTNIAERQLVTVIVYRNSRLFSVDGTNWTSTKPDVVVELTSDVQETSLDGEGLTILFMIHEVSLLYSMTSELS